MPQTDMSAEEFACMVIDMRGQKETIDAIAQRDRAILEAAAERAKTFLDSLGPEEEWSVDKLYQAIRSPLTKE